MKDLTLKDYVLIDNEKAIQDYGIHGYFYNFNDGKVALFDGNLIINGNFNIDDLLNINEDISGYLIMGNLQVETYIINTELNDIYLCPFLFVKGTTTAQNIILTGTFAFFNGDVKVENVIYGKSKYGKITFDKNVKAKAIISYYHEIEFNKGVDSIAVNINGTFQNIKTEYTENTIKEIFSKKLFDKYGYINPDKIQDYIVLNKTIFK